MSTIINATTTNGVVIQPDNSGSLVLQTNNGTTAVTISTAQNATFAGTVSMSSSFLRNRIINGDMRIDQRNAGASISLVSGGGLGYPVDRWYVENATDGTATIQQITDSPTGFSNSIRYTVTATDTSLASDQSAFIQQRIEGFNSADLMYGTANAQTITLSFWVKSSVTGTFGGALANNAYNRGYPFTYTISSANTWEQKSVTITGDTTGTWIGATNGVGLRLSFALAAGSARVSTAGTWAAYVGIGASGGTNIMATNGATFQISGVQLEIGTSATPFERRLFNQELANCQRYFEKSCNYGSVPGSVNFESILKYAEGTSNFITITWNFRVSKRANPTIVAYSPNTGTSGKMRINAGDINAAVDWFTENSASIYANNVSVATNDAARVYATASAEL
jgi:hypothetical protein